jgi:hypothetical protein
MMILLPLSGFDDFVVVVVVAHLQQILHRLLMSMN